jgi:hypothetical protein
MTFNGIIARINAIIHKLLNLNHYIIWRYLDKDDDKNICEGDIVCQTCNIIFWCRYYDKSKKEQIESLIPKGLYCYNPLEYPNKQNGYKFKIKRCPYWSINDKQHSQDNGFCSYLNKGDWEENGTSLLWDQVKECGINE